MSVGSVTQGAGASSSSGLREDSGLDAEVLFALAGEQISDREKLYQICRLRRRIREHSSEIAELTKRRLNELVWSTYNLNTIEEKFERYQEAHLLSCTLELKVMRAAIRFGAAQSLEEEIEVVSVQHEVNRTAREARNWRYKRVQDTILRKVEQVRSRALCRMKDYEASWEKESSPAERRHIGVQMRAAMALVEQASIFAGRLQNFSQQISEDESLPALSSFGKN